jgi:hypothetical protein
LEYATTLNIPFVFSSNGDGFVFHNRTGKSREAEANLSLDQFPALPMTRRSCLCAEPRMRWTSARLVGAIPGASWAIHRSLNPYLYFTERRKTESSVLPGGGSPIFRYSVQLGATNCN